MGGTYKNAYITKKPNAVDPSDWINKQQENINYVNELKAQKKKDAFNQAEKDRLEFKADTAFQFDMKAMGEGRVDQALSPYLQKSIADLNDAKNDVEEALATHGLRSEKYSNALQKFDNISMRGKNFRLVNEAVVTKLNAIQTLVDEGKIYQSPENIKKQNDFATNPIEIRENDKGENRFFQGDNIYSVDGIGAQLDFGKIIYKIDNIDVINGITETIGTKVYDKISGYTKTTNTNPWEDYTNEKGEKMAGIKNILTKGIESSLTDDVVESVLAGKGQFGYDEMPQETKDELKAGILENWLEIGRGQVEEKLGVSFDSARYRVDSKNTTPTDKTTGIMQGLSKNKIRPSKSVYGDKITKINSKNKWSVQPAKSVQIGNRIEQQLPTFNTIKDLESGDTYSNVTIESYTFDDVGNFITKISYVSDKGGKVKVYLGEDGEDRSEPEKKETEIIRADIEVKRDIANFLGISIDDLWNLAVDKEDEQKEDKTEDKKEETKEERLARMKAAINTTPE